MDEYELARRAYALPGRFTDRLENTQLDNIRDTAEGGEWTEEIDLLLAYLQQGNKAISPDERDELQAVLDALRAPDGSFDVPDDSPSPQDRLNALKVTG